MMTGIIMSNTICLADERQLISPENQTLIYKTLADGTSLELDLDLTEGDNSPVILYVHSWSGSKNQLKAYSRRLAKIGVSGVRINYRKLSEGHSFEQAYSDISDAIIWIKENASYYGLDMKRFGISGASAGGLLSAILALETPDCLLYIGFNGGYDLVQRDASRWPPESRLENLLSSPEPENDKLRHWSPIYRIKREHQPAALLLHGTSDEIITYPVAERFANALENVGASVELIAFEGEGHGFFNASRPLFEEIFSHVRNHVELHLLGVSHDRIINH